MPVENVVLAAGHESDRLGLAFHGEIDHGRSLGILGEQVAPGLKHGRMDQNDLASDVPCLLEIGFGPVANVDNGDVLHGRERWCPSHRDGTHAERRQHGSATHLGSIDLISRGRGHLRGAFGPGVRNGESLGMNAVGSRGRERLYPPRYGMLHAESAGNAAPDLIG